jgi:hypothetical protein
MTKQLAEFLDLPPITETTPEEAIAAIAENKNIIAEVNVAISKIDAALPIVKDLEAGDAELDELAKLAKDKAEDLIDLGMNIDPRFAGTILQTAGVLLGHSISAKVAKMDKKLRTVQLQLQKARLDHQISKDTEGGEAPIEGAGMVLDRNELLARILASNSQKK